MQPTLTLSPALTRTLVTIAAITAILIGCIIILQPFIPALILALILSLATWPAFEWLENKLGHRTMLAAALMTLFLAACFLVPLLFLGTSLTENFSKVYTMIITAVENPGQPPEWALNIPWAKDFVETFWRDYMGDASAVTEELKIYSGKVTPWLINFGAVVGRGLIDITLGVLIAFFLFRHGVQAAEKLRILINRFVGPRGQHLLTVSKKTMIGVVYGLLGTALVQGALAGIGFWITGIPGAPFLGLVTFLISFIPMGPPFIWVPASIWLFAEGQVFMGVVLAVWGLVLVSSIDNIIRPYFISLGSDLPLLLVLLGVLGGIIAFGFIGLFIGPTLLALAYTLIVEWSYIDKDNRVKENRHADRLP